MKALFQSLSENVQKLVSSIGWNDVLDILIITIAIFAVIKLFSKTRTTHLFRGLILLVIVYFVVSVFQFPTSSFVLRKFFSNIVIVLVLIFQPEIRHAIEEFGRGRMHIANFKFFGPSNKNVVNAEISSIVNACINMGENRVGALIILEGKTPLTEIIATGSKVDAQISSIVIQSVFFPKAPLHDGAMIIRNERIDSAGCILPLTEKKVDVTLGTRHRAAIGLSEISDALCVVVSEETGQVSVAKEGNINIGLNSAQLLDELGAFLLPSER